MSIVQSVTGKLGTAYKTTGQLEVADAPFSTRTDLDHFVDFNKMVIDVLSRILAGFFCLFKYLGKVSPFIIAQ